MTSLKHGGQAIVDSLQLHGVNRTYVVPGESYLSVLDGLYNADIQTIVCRHEAACTYMADAHGKFTGQPGIAMVTRGPGRHKLILLSIRHGKMVYRLYCLLDLSLFLTETESRSKSLTLISGLAVNVSAY